MQGFLYINPFLLPLNSQTHCGVYTVHIMLQVDTFSISLILHAKISLFRVLGRCYWLLVSLWWRVDLKTSDPIWIFLAARQPIRMVNSPEIVIDPMLRVSHLSATLWSHSATSSVHVIFHLFRNPHWCSCRNIHVRSLWIRTNFRTGRFKWSFQVSSQHPGQSKGRFGIWQCCWRRHR